MKHNANNATQYLKLGCKRRKNFKHNYYRDIIFPRVMIKAKSSSCETTISIERDQERAILSRGEKERERVSVCVRVCERGTWLPVWEKEHAFRYVVATMSRLLKIIGLFCRISSVL